jgi:hypothetical protein
VQDLLLRQYSNVEFARLTGRSVHSVENRRRRLGLRWRFKPWNGGPLTQITRRDAFWSEDEEALLGTLSDKRLARKIGRSVEAVRARRQSKRISTKKRWRPADDKVLGTRPDSQILQIGAPAPGLWDDMFDVEGGSLKALVHQAILAPAGSACPNCAGQFFRDAH